MMSYLRRSGEVVRMFCLENVFILYKVALWSEDRFVGDGTYEGLIIWLLKRFYYD